MPKVLLSVPHQHQQSDGDCLAACAAMVLAHLGHVIDYPQLLRLLKIKSYDENLLYVNDPDRSKAPIAVPRGDFELAWLERDYYYALIVP